MIRILQVSNRESEGITVPISLGSRYWVFSEAPYSQSQIVGDALRGQLLHFNTVVLLYMMKSKTYSFIYPPRRGSPGLVFLFRVFFKNSEARGLGQGIWYYTGVTNSIHRLSALAVSLLIGLSLFLSPLLKHIPYAVLFGVFLYMGISSMKGIQFFERLMLFIKPVKHHPRVNYVRRVSILIIFKKQCKKMYWTIAFDIVLLLLNMIYLVRLIQWNSLKSMLACYNIRVGY